MNDFIVPAYALCKRSKECHKEVIMRSQQGVIKKPSEGNKYFRGDIIYGSEK